MSSFQPHGIWEEGANIYFGGEEFDPWTVARDGYLAGYLDSDYDDWRPYDTWTARYVLIRCALRGALGGRDVVATVKIIGRRDGQRRRLRVHHFRVSIEFEGTHMGFFDQHALKGFATSLIDVRRQVEAALPLLQEEARKFLLSRYRPRSPRLVWKKDETGEWQPFATDLNLYGFADDLMRFSYGDYRVIAKKPEDGLVVSQLNRHQWGYAGSHPREDVSGWRPATWFPPTSETDTREGEQGAS